MAKKQVAFVTGSRAEYGILRQYLRLLDQDQEIDLTIIVTGALLDSKYGHQVDLIYEDGFTSILEVKVRMDSQSNVAVLHTMAEIMDRFGQLFEETHYDLLIILGDRYEMLPVAISAAMQQIPILHVHGGEATIGNYDEFIRHCITKMSVFHFTATEKYRERVIQLGEEPSQVFNVGALGAENCMSIDESNVPLAIRNLAPKSYFVVLFHPETLTRANTKEQMQEIIRAMNCFAQYQFVFIGTNADTHSDDIRQEIAQYMEHHTNTFYFENLHTDAYHYLLKNAVCLIGNSSSGLIEAPSLGIFTINIGDRQKGRVRGNSVMDVMCKDSLIRDAIQKVLDFNGTHARFTNPYHQEHSLKKYYDITKTLLGRLNDPKIKNPKEFYDLETSHRG